MKGMLSFGNLYLVSSLLYQVFSTTGHASKTSISSIRRLKTHIDNETGSQYMAQTKKE